MRDEEVGGEGGLDRDQTAVSKGGCHSKCRSVCGGGGVVKEKGYQVSKDQVALEQELPILCDHEAQ
jgi:hypothetical protein